MRSAIRIVLGIMVGVLLSLMTLIVAQAGASALLGPAAFGRAVMVSVLLSGALLGAASVGLGYLTAGIERSVLVLLIGLGLAALVVLLGRYGNGSILPLGIYSLAVVNSLTIARVTAVLNHQGSRSNHRELRS